MEATDRETRDLALFVKAAQILAMEPGISEAAFLNQCGADRHRVRSVVGPGLMSLCAPEDRGLRGGGARQWTDEQMLGALREASTRLRGRVPEARYRTLRAHDPDRAPHTQTIITRFGTWNNALRAAGVESNEPTREDYDPDWDAVTAIEAVARFIISELTTSGAVYREWATRRDGFPSSASIVRLMSWREASISALQLLRTPAWQPLLQRRMHGEVLERAAAVGDTRVAIAS